MFVLDRSASMTDFGFEVMKQLMRDVIAMLLPTGAQMRVAAVSFAVDTDIVFGFTNAPDVDYMQHPFTGNAFL